MSDAIVIMTSNLGSEHFRKLTNPLGFLSAAVDPAPVRGDICRELERRFSPEFRNRIDETVIFSPLAREDVRRIATRDLASIDATLAAAGRRLHVDDQALELIVDDGYSLASGARFLKRVVDEQIKDQREPLQQPAEQLRRRDDRRGGDREHRGAANSMS